MTYEAMARRWRPQVFAEVAAQSHITETLRRAIESGRVAAAYVFSGPRGSGKTTVARIVAKAVNCDKPKAGEPCDSCDSCKSVTEGRSLDVLEIDGASNNSVDDVRELRENVRYSPSAPGKRKVYIIDEVHMLSPGAFNALLKTLEEPPPHVLFVFATTNPDKIPDTILSRCQRFDFRRLLAGEILDRLRSICKKEKIQVEDGALFILAKRAYGSLRDGLSSLDQVISSTTDGVSEADVAQVLGVVQEESYFELSEAVLDRDTVRALDVLHGTLRQGVDASGFTLGLVEHLRNLLLLCIDPKLQKAVQLGESHLGQAEKLAKRFQAEDLLYLLNRASTFYEEVKRAAQPTFIVEAFLVEMTRFESRIVLEDLLAKLDTTSGSPKRSADPTGPARVRPEPRPAPKGRSTGSTKDRKIQGTGTSPPSEGASAPLGPWSGQGGATPASGGFEGPVAGPVGAVGVEAVPAVETEGATVVRTPDLEIGQVREQWNGFTQALRNQKAMLAHCLSEGRPTRLEASTVHVWFPPEHTFHLNLFREVAKKREIEQYLQAYFGRPLRVALCQDSPAGDDVLPTAPEPDEDPSRVPTSSDTKEPKPEQPVADPPAPDIGSGPDRPAGLETILEAFEGEIQDEPSP